MLKTAKSAIVSMSIVFLSTIAVAPAFASDIFEDAKKYTVKIKTTIKWPFFDERRGTSKGSGFVIDKEKGWILTNAHVAARSPSVVSVGFFSGEQVDAKKIYVDPFLDLAVISVPHDKIPAQTEEARMDCVSDVAAGTPVGAMGHPGGFSFTGTKGIISGKTSRLDSEFLQTDAPINPGNSGGPLISEKSGKVVGVNTAIIAGSQNTNFAISAKYACKITRILADGGDPSPMRTGLVFYRDVDEEKKLKIAAKRSYAAVDARDGDVVLSANGEANPENETQLADSTRGLKFLEIWVEREGQRIFLSGTAEKEENPATTQGIVVSGMLIGETTKAVEEDVALPATRIEFVENGGIAEAQEIGKGDFLFEVNGSRPKSLSHLEEIIKAAGAKAKFKIKRMSGNRSGLFQYMEKELPIFNVERILGADDSQGK